MTLPRFRLQTLMVVVAVTALVLGVGVARRRAERLSAEYRARAAQWQRKAAVATILANGANCHVKRRGPSDVENVRLAEFYLRQAEYGRAMKAKYKQTAAHPWRPVAPDPPEPK